jgi:hypothetical protein
MVSVVLLPRILRRWLSSWLVVAVLFTQLATAAYVCPMAAVQNAEPAPVAVMPCAAMMSATDGVPPDPDQPGLCMHHCQDASQTFEPATPVSIPAPTLLSTPTVSVQEPARIELPVWAAHQRRRDGAPPLPHSIDHCCYRI